MKILCYTRTGLNELFCLLNKYLRFKVQDVIHTVCFTNFGKENLLIVVRFFATATAASKFDACYENSQICKKLKIISQHKYK
jgi:hypothetical protein